MNTRERFTAALRKAGGINALVACDSELSDVERAAETIIAFLNDLDYRAIADEVREIAITWKDSTDA